MSAVRKDWRTNPDGSMVLYMEVVVNGSTLTTRSFIRAAERSYWAYPPFDVLERNMLHNLKREVERSLFGCSP